MVKLTEIEANRKTEMKQDNEDTNNVTSITPHILTQCCPLPDKGQQAYDTASMYVCIQSPAGSRRLQSPTIIIIITLLETRHLSITQK
jgi:hypothetical protein